MSWNKQIYRLIALSESHDLCLGYHVSAATILQARDVFKQCRENCFYSLTFPEQLEYFINSVAWRCL